MLLRCGFLAALAASTDAAILRSAKDIPISPIYPIGVKNETFARAVGTRFEIDGKVQYLSGQFSSDISHPTLSFQANSF